MKWPCTRPRSGLSSAQRRCLARDAAWPAAKFTSFARGRNSWRPPRASGRAGVQKGWDYLLGE
eukprot:45257-Lingulodinium_polyedra.AAC.1